MNRIRLTAALATAALIVATSGAATAITGCGGYPEDYDNGGVSGCCKICTTGKACGDSCISRSYECHVGAGCACDG